MKSRIAAVTILAIGTTVAAFAAETRTWTSTTGTTIEAAFEKYEMEVVYLKLENGRTLRVNRNQLDDKDWRYLESQDPDFRIARVKLCDSSALIRHRDQTQMARSEEVTFYYTSQDRLEIRKADGVVASIPFQDSILNPFLKNTSSRDKTIAVHSIATNHMNIAFAFWTIEAPFVDPQAKLARDFSKSRVVPYNFKVMTNFDAIVAGGQADAIQAKFVYLTFDKNHPYRFNSSRQNVKGLLEANPAFQRLRHLRANDSTSGSQNAPELDGYKTFERAK